MSTFKKITNFLAEHDQMIVKLSDCIVMLDERSKQIRVTAIRQSHWPKPQFLLNEYQFEEACNYDIQFITDEEILELAKDAMMNWLPIRNYEPRMQFKIADAIYNLSLAKMTLPKHN